MSKRTIGADGLDEPVTPKTSEQRKIERLEMALMLIKSWAYFQSQGSQKTFADILRKCEEALK